MAKWQTWRVIHVAREYRNGNFAGISGGKPTRLTVKARTEEEAMTKMRQKILSMRISGAFSVDLIA